MVGRYREKGQALLIVLISFLLVMTIIAGSLVFVGVSLKTNKTYDYNTISTYSAEAGIQDAIDKIQNESETDLINFFGAATLPASDDSVNPPYTPPPENPTYNPYDYGDRWAYVLPDSPIPTTLSNGTTTTTATTPVNNQPVNVYVQNVWVPTNIPVPITSSPPQAQANYNLIVHGTGGSSAPYYDVTITNDGTSSITLKTVGVWLNQGFSYVANSSNLTQGTYTEQVTSDAGNKAVIWTFNSGLTVNTGSSNAFTIQFEYSETSGTTQFPMTISWVTTTAASPYNNAWDLSTTVHLITADAGNTVIQAYSPNNQTIMPAAMSGDYYATGSSSMMSSVNNAAYRDILLDSSSASTVNSPIPTDAEVDGAYLYWSGYVQGPTNYSINNSQSGDGYANGIFWDQCGLNPNNATNTINGVSVPNNWKTTGTWALENNGQSGQQYNAYFQGTGSCSLTMINNLDLSKMTSGVTISWMQYGSGSVTLALGANGSFSNVKTSTPTSTWAQVTYTISGPSQYLCSAFNMSISHSGSGNVDLDDILITNNSITTYYPPSVNLTITNTSGIGSGSQTVFPIDQNNEWSAPVSSPRSTQVKFTQGLNIVNGSGFTTNVIAGNYIRSANDSASSWYLVTSVNSDTQLTLNSSYTGATNTSSYYIQDGYYYACKADVTSLVREYSNKISPDPYGNGIGTYTVSNLFGSTESAQYVWPDLGDSAYVGWSLVIIYSDALTLGHQLYLYDFPESVPANGPNGSPYVINQTLSGFIVPPKLSSTESESSDVAELTCFVGEGDVGLTGDYVAYIDSNGTHYLWDGINCTDNTGSGYDTLTGNSDSSPLNVWNSAWIDQATMEPALVPGVDIDTFHIEWGENLIKANQTSATIQLSTDFDGYVLVYEIMAFRSSVTSGGPISYLITRGPN